MSSEDIQRAREFANELRDSLPNSIDVAALGVRSKAPFQLLCTREALIWRTEELARNGCDALERDDFAAAAIHVRAITESAALTWKLMEVLDNRKEHSPQALNDILMRMLAGSRNQVDMPKAFNVLDCIDRMNKKIPGVRKGYDNLSEIAHPNWMGVLGLYSKSDQENLITYFGRGLRGAEGTRSMIVNSMLGSVGLFKYAYNRISEMMPEFVSELESLWPEDKSP